MEISIKNLGVLRQATFTIGELTILCGGNNSGKTYATYALFGFLETWRDLLSIEIDDSKLDQLLGNGITRLDLKPYSQQSEKILSQTCHAYIKRLPKILAAPEDRFKEIEYQVKFNISDIYFEQIYAQEYEQEINFTKTDVFLINKAKNDVEIAITWLEGKKKVEIPKRILERFISRAIGDILFSQLIPKPFIASAERTGATIFRKELNFDQNRLLEGMLETLQPGKKTSSGDLLMGLFKHYNSSYYSLPIQRNVDFIRQLESTVRTTSFIAESYPDLLADFTDIIGGDYTVMQNDELYYRPKNTPINLSISESSSAVRSLLDIGFYLRHVAQPGDMLMVDEPELNLHPENQRRVARLLARLVNIGVKVFITTHSDYIIKELNTLVMLNHDKPHLQEIAKREGYRPEELMDAGKLRVYIAETDSIVLEGDTEKTTCQTLTPANIDPEFGIEARSFDTTIEAMNRIQDAIIWGQT